MSLYSVGSRFTNKSMFYLFVYFIFILFGGAIHVHLENEHLLEVFVSDFLDLSENCSQQPIRVSN